MKHFQLLIEILAHYLPKNGLRKVETKKKCFNKVEKIRKHRKWIVTILNKKIFKGFWIADLD